MREAKSQYAILGALALEPMSGYQIKEVLGPMPCSPDPKTDMTASLQIVGGTVPPYLVLDYIVLSTNPVGVERLRWPKLTLDLSL